MERLPGLEPTVGAGTGDFAVEPLPGLEPAQRAVPEVSVQTLPGLEPTLAAAQVSVEVEPLPGLEPTRTGEALQVSVEPLPGLITNEEALGAEYRLETRQADGRTCARCGAPLAGARVCPACGHVTSASEPQDVPQHRRCPECGVPSPPGWRRCASCGGSL